MVVEDDPVLRFLIVEELENAGYDVLAARDAHSAIQMIETHVEIGLILTDIDLLSKGEGLDLAAIVRSRWPAIRIIITSGNWSFRPNELPFAELRHCALILSLDRIKLKQVPH